MLGCCISLRSKKPLPWRVTGNLRCASRWPPEGTVEERIHRLDDGVRIGSFGRQQQTAANERLDFTIAQFEPIAAKAVVAALPAAAHPLGGPGAGDLSVCDNRGGDALV